MLLQAAFLFRLLRGVEVIFVHQDPFIAAKYFETVLQPPVFRLYRDGIDVIMLQFPLAFHGNRLSNPVDISGDAVGIGIIKQQIYRRNILSGTVISALIYGALTTATHALLGALGSNVVVALVVSAVGVILAVLMKKKGKTVFFVLGIILALMGVFSLVYNLGGFFKEIPFLAIGIPAVTGAYFDWFGGCIQAFIFCTLTTLFIKQAAGD